MAKGAKMETDEKFEKFVKLLIECGRTDILLKQIPIKFKEEFLKSYGMG